jgi:hypothetical protein
MKSNKPKYRIKKITKPECQPYYVCEERHWLWGWNDMFIVYGFGRYNQTFSSEEDARKRIEKEIEKRKGDTVKIIWKGHEA